MARGRVGGLLFCAMLCGGFLVPAVAHGAEVFSPAQKVPELPPELSGRVIEAATPDPQGWLVVETSLRSFSDPDDYDLWIQEGAFHRLSRQEDWTTITVVSLRHFWSHSIETADLLGFQCTREGVFQGWVEWLYLYMPTSIRFAGEYLTTGDSGTITELDYEDGYSFELHSAKVSSCTLNRTGSITCLRTDRVFYPAPAPPTGNYFDPASGIEWTYASVELDGQLVVGLDDMVACVDARGGQLTETVLTESGVTSRSLGAFGDGRTILTCASNADTSVVVYLSSQGDAHCWTRQGATETDLILGHAPEIAVADWAMAAFDSSGGLHAILCRAGTPLRVFYRSAAGQVEWFDPADRHGLTGINSITCSLHDPDHPQVVVGCDQGVVYYEFADGKWNARWLAPTDPDVKYRCVHAGITTTGKAVTWRQSRWTDSQWVYDGVWVRESIETTSTAVQGNWAVYD